MRAEAMMPYLNSAMAAPVPGPSAAAAGQRVATARSAAAIERTAKDFEAVFLTEMLRPMFSESTAEAPFGGGIGEDIWRSMQVDEFGKALAARGGIGLADAVAREMLHLQEHASGERQ